MKKSQFQIVVSLLAFLLNVTSVFSQVTDSNLFNQSSNDNWFIVRVLSHEPFVLETVDWKIQEEPITPQNSPARLYLVEEDSYVEPESIRKFKTGDILIGEACIVNVHDNCGEIENKERSDCPIDSLCVEFPKTKIINLRKVRKSVKKKYKDRGFLYRYSPKDRKIRDLTIFRDGEAIVNDSYGNPLRRKLSKTQIKLLTRSYFRKRIHKLPNNEKVHTYMPGLISSVSGFRKLVVENSSESLEEFTAILDMLVEDLFKSAEYRIKYRQRHLIKDWNFGEVLPLDKFVTGQQSYLKNNRSQILDNTRLLNELEKAKSEYSEKELSLFRYEGKIYELTFLPCRFDASFTLDCILAWEVNRAGDNYSHLRTSKVFWNWPDELQVNLKDIPKEGLDISTAELQKHQNYYKKFIPCTNNLLQKEKNYIYSEIYIEYR